MIKRPPFADQRIDWWPGEGSATPSIKFRHGEWNDYYGVRALTSCTYAQWYRWCTYRAYTTWLVVRNFKHVVGLIVARHNPLENKVIRFAILPKYYKDDIMDALLSLVQTELPEGDTVWTFSLTEDARLRALRAKNWKVDNASDQTGDVTVRHGPLAR